MFRRRQFFQGRRIRGAEVKDLTWFEPNGQEMTDQAWDADSIRCLMVRLSGDSIEEVDAQGERDRRRQLPVAPERASGGATFKLPGHRAELQWERMLDTGDPDWGRSLLLRGERYRLRGRAVAVFRSYRRR